MRLKEDSWLFTRHIAHRGLWGDDVPENSLTAYARAVEKGYAIEIDLYLSKDGVLFSVHDSKLKRLCGVDKFVYDLTAEEIKQLSLCGTDEKIPTFDEVLELVDGKTPLLIEIKDQPSKLIVENIVGRLKTYKGEFALQSFNPFYIRKVRYLAPEFIRGILAAKNPDTDSKIKKFVVSKMPFNFTAKPDFISYEYNGLPLKTKLPVITWTVTTKDIHEKVKPYAKNIIFEGFIPED